VLRRRVVFRDFLDANRIRDAQPAMIIDLGIHGLVFRAERGSGGRRLVHENHRELILPFRSRDPLRVDHAGAIVILVSIVIAEHGKNFMDLRLRDESCAGPIVNQSRLDP
jgi:hypothetical protein